MKPLYKPKLGKKMRVYVFGSGSGTNLEALLRSTGNLFEVCGIFVDRPCNCVNIGQRNNIPVLYMGEDAGKTREERDRILLGMLNRFQEETGAIDIVALAGYMRIVSYPLVEAFEYRIINVHPADLSILGENGKRKYRGGKAVENVLAAGEETTRSTVHLVNQEMDEGKIIARSKELPLKDYSPSDAKRVQEIQKQKCDWPAYAFSVTSIAQGRVAMDDSGILCFDGKQMKEGVDLGALWGDTKDPAILAAREVTGE